jgi:hypothetical protein
MPTPVPFVHPGGGTLYGMIDLADRRWNGSAFEAVIAAHVDQYAIVPDRVIGTSDYRLPFPDGLDAGSYRILIYLQVGSSRDLSADTPLYLLPWHWTGTQEVSLPAMAALLGRLVSLGVAGTVAQSISSRAFRGDPSLATDDNRYADQFAYFTTGPLAGYPARIKSYEGASRTFTVYTPLPATPGVGDGFLVIGKTGM